MPTNRALLRLFVFAAAIAGTLFSIGVVIDWWLIPNDHRDGLELIGLWLVVAFFLVLVLPALMLGYFNRWLPFAAALGVVNLALVSDTLWPWLPW